MQEFLSSSIIVGNDRIAVMRTIFADMLDRIFEGADRSDRKDQIQIFGAPIFLRRRPDFRTQDLSGQSVTPKLNAALPKRIGARWQELTCDLFVDQQRFDSIADGWSLAFGVDHNSFPHERICRSVYVHRTNPVEMLDYRHPRSRCDRLDQGPAPPRNDQLNIAIKLRHQRDSGPVRAWHKLDRVSGQASVLASMANRLR